MDETSNVITSVWEKGKNIRPNTLFNVKKSITFGELFEKSIGNDDTLLNIEIECSVSDIKASNVVVVNLGSNVSVCEEFGLKFIKFVVSKPESPDRSPVPSSSNTTKKNAFKILMGTAKAMKVPDKITSDDKLIAPQRLYNDIIDFLEEENVKWTASCIESGEKTVRVLRDVLWYTTSHHDKFSEAGCRFPDKLKRFSGYNDWKKNRHQKPVIQSEKLDEYCDNLISIMELPSNSTGSNKVLITLIQELLESIRKMSSRMKKDNKAHKNVFQRRSEPARVPERDCSSEIRSKVTNVRDQYRALDRFVVRQGHYTIVDLSDLTSGFDRYDRRKYIADLQLSQTIMIYKMAYGNSIGTLTFICSIPDEPSPERETRCAQVMARVNADLPIYSSRDMRKNFIEKYTSHLKGSKSVLRHLYRELTNDSSAPDSQEQGVIDERVAEILLSSDDSELLIDHRALNGQPGETKFSVFYDECEKFFQEKLAPVVNERRHGQELYMPLAISIEDLRSQVKERLPEDVPVPSSESLRLQFFPSHQYANTALKHSGRFDIKFKVQSRLSHANHVDSKYVFTQYQYLKQMAVKYRDNAIMCCLDDKAIVPVGEPEIQISTGVRGHNRVLAPLSGSRLSACDHDFHTCGIVPSVAMINTIPENSSDSFFNGTVHVSVKDKMFQPSTAMRHATELLSILREYESNDDVKLKKPILFLFTDGGPDHRVTFDTVKLSLLVLFIQLDLDMLVALRTAPHHSWVNPAERCMSILNLALQHVALAREKMTDEHEIAMKNKSSLSAVRNYAERSNAFKEALIASMEPVTALLKNRFGRMKLKGESLIVHDAATNEDLKSVINPICIVLSDNSLTSDIDSKALKSHAEFYKFINSHGKSTHYCFQLKKCTQPDCGYCVLNPPTLQEFEDLHFLPDPIPDKENVSYKTFQQVYGTNTTDIHRPSLQEPSVSNLVDKDNKALLNAGKVRAIIKCSECSKPRCLYAATKLTVHQATAITQTKEDGLYICGMSLFNEDHQFYKVIVTRQSINCTSPIESTYYSASTVALPTVVFTVGNMIIYLTMITSKI